MLIGIFVGWRFCNCCFGKRKWEKNLFNIDMIKCNYFLKIIVRIFDVILNNNKKKKRLKVLFRGW